VRCSVARIEATASSLAPASKVSATACRLVGTYVQSFPASRAGTGGGVPGGLVAGADPDGARDGLAEGAPGIAVDGRRAVDVGTVAGWGVAATPGPEGLPPHAATSAKAAPATASRASTDVRTLPRCRKPAAISEAFRQEWGRVVATLIRMSGDWDIAEDCTQDAFAQAVQRWPRDGIPQRPGAWLTTVARNRALDRLRRSTTEAAKLHQAAALLPGSHADGTSDLASASQDGDIPDDRLRLIFTCCHPALALEARVALTLRHPGRADHRRDRVGVSRAGAHHGKAPGPG